MSLSGQIGSIPVPALNLTGTPLAAATAGTTNPIVVLARDHSRNILMATGTEVPASVGGYAKGCLFVNTGVSAGTTGLYVNVGSTTAVSFKAVSNAV